MFQRFGDGQYSGGIMSIEAHCTWGDGPDVLVTVKHKGEPIKWFDLMGAEAVELGTKFVNAGLQAIDLDRSWALEMTKVYEDDQGEWQQVHINNDPGDEDEVCT